MTRGREEFAIDTSGRERHGSATWTKQPKAASCPKGQAVRQ